MAKNLLLKGHSEVLKNYFNDQLFDLFFLIWKCQCWKAAYLYYHWYIREYKMMIYRKLNNAAFPWWHDLTNSLISKCIFPLVFIPYISRVIPRLASQLYFSSDTSHIHRDYLSSLHFVKFRSRCKRTWRYNICYFKLQYKPTFGINYNQKNFIIFRSRRLCCRSLIELINLFFWSVHKFFLRQIIK